MSSCKPRWCSGPSCEDEERSRSGGESLWRSQVSLPYATNISLLARLTIGEKEHLDSENTDSALAEGINRLLSSFLCPPVD